MAACLLVRQNVVGKSIVHARNGDMHRKQGDVTEDDLYAGKTDMYRDTLTLCFKSR